MEKSIPLPVSFSEKVLPKTQEGILEYVKISIWIMISIIFLSVYLPIEIASCNQTLNRTPEYIYNATCFCKNNVGSSSNLGTVMFKNSSWYAQFPEEFSIAYDPLTGLMAFALNETINVKIAANAIPYYLQNYYSIEFTTTLFHDKQIDMFEFYDPFGIETFQPACEVRTYSDNIKVIFDQVYNTSSECSNALITKLDGKLPQNFTSILQIGYLTNPIYASACDLDYCEIPYCPQSQQVTIFFFCCTVIGTLFQSLRLLTVIALWFMKKYNSSFV